MISEEACFIGKMMLVGIYRDERLKSGVEKALGKWIFLYHFFLISTCVACMASSVC